MKPISRSQFQGNFVPVSVHFTRKLNSINRRDAILALAALGLAPTPGRTQPAGLRKIGIFGISNLEPSLGYLREGLRELGYV